MDLSASYASVEEIPPLCICTMAYSRINPRLSFTDASACRNPGEDEVGASKAILQLFRQTRFYFVNGSSQQGSFAYLIQIFGKCTEMLQIGRKIGRKSSQNRWKIGGKSKLIYRKISPDTNNLSSYTKRSYFRPHGSEHCPFLVPLFSTLNWK